MLPKIKSILNSYSEIFFLQGPITGALLLGITLLNPNSALTGAIAVLTAFLFATFIGYKDSFLSSGFFTYNALLVGLSIGILFQLNFLSLTLLISASILTFVITIGLSQVFSQYLRLHILSIPFVIVSSLVYLAASRLSNLHVTSLYAHPIYADFTFLPNTLNTFFKAMGSIIFLPNAISGILISILILYTSRILFLLGFSGFFIGTTVQMIYLGSWNQALLNPNSFNYILIAMAIGGTYLIPSLQSYILAFIGVAVSTLLMSSADVFWAQYGIPAFTLPFTVITLSFVYVLGLVNFRLRPLVYKSNPEETLDYFITSKNRFPDTPITLALPFDGAWTVWQAFDGKWTHQGLWKYGYDFVKFDDNGKTYEKDGTKLDHYYCFKKEVQSPVQGRVVKVINSLEDNPIGSVDTLNNWGNLVIIHDTRGYFIELSHFAQDSIEVKEGSWVEPGTRLGLCGNSGYSPQPHIHIQVQTTATMGSPTLPFQFVHYKDGLEYIAHGLPNEKSVVAPMGQDLYYDQLTTFILDDTLTFNVTENGIKTQTVSMTVKMAPDATFYLETQKGKLYLGKSHRTFYCYHTEGNDPYLKLIYLALPKVPLAHEAHLHWTDALSSVSVLSGLSKFIVSLTNAFTPTLFETKGHYQFTQTNIISGEITLPFSSTPTKTNVILDPYLQIKHVTVNTTTMERIKQ